MLAHGCWLAVLSGHIRIVLLQEKTMARFLIGTVPVGGHVSPALPIARQLVERGHSVWWYTGKTLSISS